MILASYVIYETFPSVINERLVDGAAGEEGVVCVESDGVTCFWFKASVSAREGNWEGGGMKAIMWLQPQSRGEERAGESVSECGSSYSDIAHMDGRG